MCKYFFPAQLYLHIWWLNICNASFFLKVALSDTQWWRDVSLTITAGIKQTNIVRFETWKYWRTSQWNTVIKWNYIINLNYLFNSLSSFKTTEKNIQLTNDVVQNRFYCNCKTSSPSVMFLPVTLEQGWAIHFPKGPHEKLGRLQRAVGRVYGGRGQSRRFPGNRRKQSSAAPDFETSSAHI